MWFSLRITLLALLSVTALSAANARKAPTRPQAPEPAAYKGAIVVDAATGNVLFEDKPDTINPPASMTKLMTFAVVSDRLKSGALTLQTPIRIDKADSGMAGTQVFLDPRETFPVEELIYAMMIQSANDAAHALGRVAGGSRIAFVEMMNAKAKELGMTNTTFRTPHGLPPANRRVTEGDLSSPRDFAILCRYLLTQTDVLKYSSIEKRDFGAGVRKQVFKMDNHNNLLGKVAGVDGLKTGFTAGAGYCISATASRSGRRVIVVTMGSADTKTRDLKVIELLDRGFAALPPAPAAPVAPAAPTAAASAASPADVTLSPAPLRPAPANPAARTDSEPKIKVTLPKR